MPCVLYITFYISIYQKIVLLHILAYPIRSTTWYKQGRPSLGIVICMKKWNPCELIFHTFFFPLCSFCSFCCLVGQCCSGLAVARDITQLPRFSRLCENLVGHKSFFFLLLLLVFIVYRTFKDTTTNKTLYFNSNVFTYIYAFFVYI